MRNERIVWLIGLCLFFPLLALAPAAFAAPTAVCVPWQPSDPSVAHYTYGGAAVTLKGIARDGATEYRWDFGDGGGTSWATITNPYNLGVSHVYNGVVGQLFIATLHVRDASSVEASDVYPVRIYESSDLSIRSHLEVRINMSIDRGLWWLHTNMIRSTYPAGSPGYEQPYGYWSDPLGYPLPATAAAVDAFQLHGSRANTDYDSDPYVETVQRGLNYVLSNTYSYVIGLQTAGNPDVNGNGIGLVSNQTSYLYDFRQTYIGGICMVTLASSGAPNRVASVGRTNVYGRSYRDIVQDMVDFFAWGQVDASQGPFRGGWRYYANFTDSDMSTTQWPPLGMLAAEENMGSVVPQFVRDELVYFLTQTQYTSLNNDNGGFGYATPTLYLNITKTAAGIICHEFLGTPLTDPRVESAIGYIYRHWGDTGTSWDDTQLHGNSYGMYGVMKAFRIPEPDIATVTEYDYLVPEQTENEFDWYYTPGGQVQPGLASYTVATQQADGSWDDVVGSNRLYDAFSTGWRVLVLLKGVTILPPSAEICDCDEQEYNLDQTIVLDGSCSYHPDVKRSIVSYEWDFDYDGTFAADDSGVGTTIVGGYPDEGYYPVALRVFDDNPENLGGPQSSIHVCEVYVHPPPHCPHAFAGGPYLGWIGVPVQFDASASWDPDNEIVSYEWDLDNDGLFGAEDGDCFGEPSDAGGVNATRTWDAPYSGVIGLRVTDATGEFDSCPDVDYTSVDIGNHAPVAGPGGPYSAMPGSTITLDGTGSYDPDPGDAIALYEWDLNDDGVFGDSTESSPAFTVGPDLGTVYDICLKVTDNFGEYDIACTTVEVVTNQPPVADPGGSYSGAEGSPIPFDGTGSSDPDGDLLTYSWDFGDGYTGTGATPTHTYANDGTYAACLTVSDGELSNQGCATVLVANSAPAVTVAGATPLNEGDSATYNTTVVDPGMLDTHAILWDCDGDGFDDGSGTVVTCLFVDGPAIVPVRAQATDSDGASGVGQFDVEVHNVDPAVGPIDVDPVLAEVGTQIQASADFSDPGLLDTHTVVIDWGDGLTDPAQPTTSPAQGTHTYAEAGVYMIVMTVIDKDGGQGQSIFQYVVIFDPSAGFVTGGGWIISAAGAYRPDPTLTGQATFGFVSRYLRGATVPVGNTEFWFHAAGMNFHSSSYEWLVVTQDATYAQYKGHGAINGEGEYRFMLWAGDHDPESPDTFRIKIWQEDDLGTESVIYDNGIDQPLDEGTIIIHHSWNG